MTDSILIDGTRLSWAAFADRLAAFAAAGPDTFAEVRAPRGCGAETARLLSALNLVDRVSMLDRSPRARRHAIGLRHALASLLAAIRAPLGQQRRPLHD